MKNMQWPVFAKHKIKLVSVLIIFLLVLVIIFSVRNINDANLKRKIGQMIILGFNGTEVDKNSYISKLVKNLNIGGIILFDYHVPTKDPIRNIINPSQTEKLISDLNSFARTPLFIAADVEGGYVNRLKPKNGFLPVIPAQSMGEDITTETTRVEARKIALQLKDLGFNMNFGPVLDVNVNPDNPVIGWLERSFSDNPEEVTNHARTFIDEHSKKGIISVVKHFPGHGSSNTDSHLGITDITNTYKDFELEPYVALQNEGLLDVVMTAHVINKNIDEKYPATLSSKFLQDILREQIGFEGLIVSDDMHMKAISDNYGFKEAIIMSINSGCNLLILSNNGDTYDEELAQKTVDIIFEAVKSGEISKEKVINSYELITNLKNKFNIIS